MKCHWDRFFSEYVVFALSVSLHQCSILDLIFMFLSQGQAG
jgi:hypothetical protein